MPSKASKNEIVFRVDVHTPDTFPMARLAEYLSSLALLLGETHSVHLGRLAKGSTKVVQKVDPPAMEKVTARLTLVRTGAAPEEIMRAYHKVDELLRADNAVGEMKIGRTKVLAFPGRTAPEEAIDSVGPVIQHDYVDGQLIRVGGLDDTVPVTLREADGTLHRCTADIERSTKIAPYLYGVELRVSGKGHWYRDSNGKWAMKFFRIEDFEPLNETPLTDVARDLSAIPRDEWPENMIEDLRDLRRE